MQVSSERMQSSNATGPLRSGHLKGIRKLKIEWKKVASGSHKLHLQRLQSLDCSYFIQVDQIRKDETVPCHCT